MKSNYIFSNGFKLPAHDYGVMRHAEGLESTNKGQELLEVLGRSNPCFLERYLLKFPMKLGEKVYIAQAKAKAKTKSQRSQHRF